MCVFFLFNNIMLSLTLYVLSEIIFPLKFIRFQYMNEKRVHI